MIIGYRSTLCHYDPEYPPALDIYIYAEYKIYNWRHHLEACQKHNLYHQKHKY
jgi:hypothetical protein